VTNQRDTKNTSALVPPIDDPVNLDFSEQTLTRRLELQALIDEHGSVDRAAREVGEPRESFREECRALGVRAHSRGLLPKVDSPDRQERDESDRIGRELLAEIELEIEEFFVPLRDASSSVYYRLMMLANDPAASARFLLAYDRMKWWQRELLVLLQAIAMDETEMPHRVAREFLDAHLSAMRKSALLYAAAEPA
jgi:hypothetical protein